LQIVNIFVDGVGPVKWNKSAYDRLVLPAQTKELIRVLVNVRTSERGTKHGLGVAGKRVDIISGKGNGLIMLLHGGSGTGKSLTADKFSPPWLISYNLNNSFRKVRRFTSMNFSFEVKPKWLIVSPKSRKCHSTELLVAI
jgi:hypothetical protein